ncbi:pfs domain-containing protein [Lepidopterella palustris CBS 459.81]|uniref:Pfs domain-containing protein n=1 Tax=Lepidopterella palustris CBS 459.81 TaxID=1314670 RepID=A0A8E2E1Y0_9PEZI|nr:pfs domain-containing protein [Lepidopterella palustris CBS 459.81]
MFTQDVYTVACICPMGVELAPVVAMLDERHPMLPSHHSTNSYELGRMGAHNIVIAVLPEIGNNQATAVAKQLMNDFRSVRFGFLVGIGGGIPNEDQHDIRLGDIVVSKPTAKFGGIVQFDRGKSHGAGRFEITGTLNKPPQILMAAVQKLQAEQIITGSQVSKYVQDMLERYPNMKEEQYLYQGMDEDLLFESSYSHTGGSSCHNCDRKMTIPRAPRHRKSPKIHYGTIGSADQVVKDAATRDALRNDLGLICVEMEAAGLMDVFPCLVVRGICDYADSHKNKRWQPYAAAVAAAYVKELMSVIPAENVVAARTAADEFQLKQSISTC